MLEPVFFKNSEIYYQDEFFRVLKFPASSHAPEKQSRPLVYLYSIMSRGYGTVFNPDSMTQYYNEEGFDVYLVDWGLDTLYTLKGWSLDQLSHTLKDKVLLPLIQEYQVENLNLFAVCIGGVILSNLLAIDPDSQNLLHRVAYYGVPIIGARDLGMEKTFVAFYQAVSPWAPFFPDVGISLFSLDPLLLYSSSLSMIQWTWKQYFEERTQNSFQNIIAWTLDDRWVPLKAFLDIIRLGFVPKKYPQDFHFEPVNFKIHFLNVVGKDDTLVKPSASIVEWNSLMPKMFLSFEQMILNTDHFMFARPGFVEEKKKIASWFAGYSFDSLVYKVTNHQKEFLPKLQEKIPSDIHEAYQKASGTEKRIFVREMVELLHLEPDTSAQQILDRLDQKILGTPDPVWLQKLSEKIGSLVKKSVHREGNYSGE